MGEEDILRQLTKDRLMEEAVKNTGLSDFGEPGFEESLEILLESLRRTAGDLGPYGRTCALGMPLGALENRLHLAENARSHPDIARTAIHEPVFILGLPRSGTTLLHNLLAVHPALRAPLFWELQSPATPGARGGKTSSRSAGQGWKCSTRRPRASVPSTRSPPKGRRSAAGSS